VTSEGWRHAPPRACESILGAVGNTPLVRMSRFAGPVAAELFAKVEFLNPMGSIKDRIARFLVEKAERDGRLRKGDVIVEASSGNTALGLAMVAILKGYRCKMIVRDSISREKKNFLRALGVELMEVDARLPRESPDSYNNVAGRVAAGTPGAYFPDQHNNRENNEAHYRTTGPEIWEQMEGRIDYVVAGIGTGGTLSGVARYVKERDPRVQVVAVDPVGSVFHDYFRTGRLMESRRYLIEGLGDECIVGCVEFDLIDRVIQVTDQDAFLTARELARTEALLAGGSSGAAAWAARVVAREVGGHGRVGRPGRGRGRGRGRHPARIVTILPDSAFRYGSQFFSDDWMLSKGLETA
jgi:cystathionine beta-synthase